MTQDKRDMGDNGRRKEPSQVTAEVGRVSEALRDKKAHDGRGQPSDQAQQPRPRNQGKQKGGAVVHDHRGDGDEFELIGVQSASCAEKRFHTLHAPFACGGDYGKNSCGPRGMRVQ